MESPSERNIRLVATLERSERDKRSRIECAIDRPYPFTFLTLVVSLEAILLTSFVLAAQDRMTKEADRRTQLDLQLDMLSEQEVTAILRSPNALARHSGLDLNTAVPDMPELVSDTRVDRLARALQPNGKDTGA